MEGQSLSQSNFRLRHQITGQVGGGFLLERVGLHFEEF
jgi:hypothetical protein